MSYKHHKVWRHKHPRKRLRGKNKYYNKFNTGNFSGGRRWTYGEIDMITNLNHLPDRKLHELLGRSVRAIHTMRSKLKAESRETSINLRKEIT